MRFGKITLGAALVLAIVLFFPQSGWTQKNPVTKSQKAEDTKIASEPGPDTAPLPSKSPAEAERPRYAPLGKRDPFRPYFLRARVNARPRENLSPLERFELKELKLVGIVWDIKEPRAMIEDGAGLGYIIKIGTAIGTNEGTVKVIRPNEVVVEETSSDFYGARKKREVSLKLSTE